MRQSIMKLFKKHGRLEGEKLAPAMAHLFEKSIAEGHKQARQGLPHWKRGEQTRDVRRKIDALLEQRRSEP